MVADNFGSFDCPGNWTCKNAGEMLSLKMLCKLPCLTLSFLRQGVICLLIRKDVKSVGGAFPMPGKGNLHG